MKCTWTRSWEYLTHQLASEAGIWVPESTRLALGGRHQTFCVKRFDRGWADQSRPDPTARRMFASAMTLLELKDGESAASYLDLADLIETQGGERLTADLHQLFRRAVFNLLVGNRDDHLRNHGFIRVPTGWRLSPAFDLNPNADKRQHVLTWDGQTSEPDLDALTRTAPFYRIADSEQARTIVDSVKRVVMTWRDRARALQLTGSEVQRMERAFAV